MWLLVDRASGAIISGPTDARPSASASQETVRTVMGYPDTMEWSPAAYGFVVRMKVRTMAEEQAYLIDLTKAANEALVKTVYSQNYGKQKKYSRKQQEVMDFRALTPAAGVVTDVLSAALSTFAPAFSAMAVSPRRKKFRFAMAQAAKRGVTIDVVIGEFEAAIETNESKVAAWEAVEQEAIRAIKAATTIAAKRAAYAAINWAWVPTA